MAVGVPSAAEEHSRGPERIRVYYDELVGPAVIARWPGLPHAAGRLGSGSDVLGYDDVVSRDHEWGLRLNLLVPPDVVGHVRRAPGYRASDTFGGYPIRFPTTWDPQMRHRVQVEAVLEVTAGPVSVDTAGELTAVRECLAWYPDDLWAYVVATASVRIAQELPFVGRAAERGDDLGSRVIGSRLAGVPMRFAHLLERCWPPYAKWVGTSLSRLPSAGAAAEPLLRALDARDWRTREDGLVEALRRLHHLQRRIGLHGIE